MERDGVEPRCHEQTGRCFCVPQCGGVQMRHSHIKAASLYGKHGKACILINSNWQYAADDI